jgi:hypothetical protein
MADTQQVKTTLNFTPLFHAKLKAVANDNQKSMAQFIEEHMKPVIDDIHQKQHRSIFDGLYQLSGTITDNIPDASTTIDDIVYGKKGEA